MRVSLIFMLLIISGRAGAAPMERLPSRCRQCLVITTSSWSATEGRLMAFQRDDKGAWHRAGIDAPVQSGRAGLAWGRGIFNADGLAGPPKSQGEKKAPPGIV